MSTMFPSLGAAALLALPVLAQEKPVPVKPVVPKAGAAVEQDATSKAATQRVPAAPQRGVSASGGNSWFPVTVRDLGTYYGSGEAVGTFTFENPHDQEIEWRTLTPSCQCAAAEIRIGDRTYRVIAKPQKRLVRVVKTPGQPERIENVTGITIGPKEKGEIETRLDMQSIVGPKSATLDIHGTDPVEPHTKLTFRAQGAQLFTVSPKEVNLNKMTWNESREFSVTVTSTRQPEWEILSCENAGEEFDVKWERLEQNGVTSYRIDGTYGPVGGEVAGGGLLKFRTNVNGAATFDVRVLAFVQGPLTVKPGGFLTLGLIRQGKGGSKEIVFEPNDDADLKAESLTFEKTTLSSEFLTATARKDGRKLIVELAVSDSAPTGLVKGELVVRLNHPVVDEKRIMFNGFVR